MNRLGWVVAVWTALAADQPANDVRPGGGGRSPGAVPLNPVYLDDSLLACETLARIPALLASGNQAQAIRELQRLLDEAGERVVPAADGSEVFISVRARVHALLLADAGLLERYRAWEGPRAWQHLEQGDHAGVERARLLTPAGFEAALRVAQECLERGQFEGARLALEQLEHHPDRRAAPGEAAGPATDKSQNRHAREAAQLLSTVARRLNRPEVLERARRWAREAGLDPAQPEGGGLFPPMPEPGDPRTDDPVQSLPPSLRLTRLAPGDAAPPVKAADIPSRPLWTIPLGTPEGPAPGDESAPDRAPTAQWLVVGDTLVTNDGVRVTARDRFTLQPRWSTPLRPAQGSPNPVMRGPWRLPAGDEIPWVNVLGRVVVATTPGTRTLEREEESAVAAMDLDTGRLLWSLVPGRSDAQLEGSQVQGPPLLDGTLAILPVRRISQTRRTAGLYLVAVRVEDGTVAWVRPVASAGAVPWNRSALRATEICTLHEGVVYGSDGLGVIFAVEAANGRPCWVRPMPVPTAITPVPGTEPLPWWTWTGPLVVGPSLVTLAPDRSAVLRLDRTTGQTLSWCDVDRLGNPLYLVRVGNRLAAVGQTAVAFVPIDDPAQPPAEQTGPLPLRPRGRALAAGDRLLVPASEGLMVIDPARPGDPPALIPLERCAQALPLGGHVLTSDATGLHSYLTWETATALLEQRLAKNPDDPEPAITLADLAWRLGRTERIVPAADRALATMRSQPMSESVRAWRRRLFTVLREMSERSVLAYFPEPPPPEVAVPMDRRRDGPSPPPVGASPPPLPVGLLGQVVERLGHVAQEPDERVAHRLLEGRVREAQGRADLAAEAYQRVLIDPLLAWGLWRGGTVAVRADLEATRRLRTLVIEHGAKVYAAFEAQAEAELSRLGPEATTEALEGVGRRYPAAVGGAQAWARAAALHAAAGRTHAAIADLREALLAYETVYAAGGLRDTSDMGAVAGALLDHLRGVDQVFGAAQLLTRLRRQYPALALRSGAAPMDVGRLEEELQRRLAVLSRPPRIGPEISAEVQAIAGWSLMTPRSRRGPQAVEHVVMIAPASMQVGLWGTGAAPGEPRANRLQMLWSRAYSGLPPVLIRLDPDSVYLFWERHESEDGAVIERIAALGGQTVWKTEPFRGLFEPDPRWRQRVEAMRNTIETPLDGSVRLTDVLTAMDEQVLAVVERSGRAAVFDTASGRMLWKENLGLAQVHDLAVGGGVLAVGGALAWGREPTGAVGVAPVILVLDARSGHLMHRFDDLRDPAVRWTRLVEAGETPPALIAGLETRVACFDLAQGRTHWTVSGVPGTRTLDAWVMGNRLFLLDEMRSLWLVDVASGRIAGDQPLPTFDRLSGSGPVYGWDLKGNMSAFTTPRGLCVFDPRGNLVGLDALPPGDSDDALLAPVPGEGVFVALETLPRGSRPGQNVYALHLLQAPGGALRATRQIALELPPRRLTLLDSRILVSAGANTIVYFAPPAP